jgi:proton-translocating NADH-quinone oxidoreductase chain N
MNPLYIIGVLLSLSLVTVLLQLLGSRRWALAVPFAGLSFATGATLSGLLGSSLDAGGLFTAPLMVDRLGFFFAFIGAFVGLLSFLASLEYLEGDPNEQLFYSLLMASVAGIVALSFARDLLTLFVAWELMGIPTFAMAAFHKGSEESVEAGLKYFFVGALSTGLLAYGISLAYLLTGSLDLEAVVKGFASLTSAQLPLGVVAVSLLAAGFGFKMAFVPFHVWIPDAYQGAPTTLSAYLSAATKKAGFVAAIRVLLVALTVQPLLRLGWSELFALLALATMTFANLGALTQRRLTRLLAYSSIAQAGYILAGLAVSVPQAPLALPSSLFHILNHAVLSSLAFIAAAAYIKASGSDDLEVLAGSGSRLPLTSASLSIALLGLAGLPPINGFWSKLFIFSAAVQAGGLYWWSPYLALAGFLNSALSLGYYGWVIRRLYFDEGPGKADWREPKLLASICAVLAALALGIGLLPGPVFSLLYEAALPYLAG